MSSTETIRRVTNTVKRIVAYRYEYRCAAPDCRVVLPPTWECDHIIPLWKIARNPDLIKGDPNQIPNLQPLCPDCHRKKTTREVLEREAINLREMYGEDSGNMLCLDELLKVQTVPEPETPTFHKCTACNLRYSPHFDHECKMRDFRNRFSFNPDRT